jgi:hypothetical protein
MKDEIGGACSTHEKLGIHTPFSWNTLKEDTALETRRRWEDNINMDVAEIRYEGLVWVRLAQDKVQ